MNFLINILAKIFYRVLNSSHYKNIVGNHSWEVHLNTLKEFKSVGENVYLPNECLIKNPKYISIGSNFSSLYNLRIEAWDSYAGQDFSPEIKIGNNVSFNSDVHIGCINKVVIGDNVLLASKIYISDHSHGKVIPDDIAIPPNRRKLYSKGPVIINNNVWIGESVSILPGITIGANAIIGANSVVTRDVPTNAVVAGNPARIVRMLV